MKSRTHKITERELRHIILYITGEHSLTQLMKATGTNTMSVYSLVARGSRIAYERGLLK